MYNDVITIVYRKVDGKIGTTRHILGTSPSLDSRLEERIERGREYLRNAMLPIVAAVFQRGDEPPHNRTYTYQPKEYENHHSYHREAQLRKYLTEQLARVNILMAAHSPVIED